MSRLLTQPFIQSKYGVSGDNPETPFVIKCVGIPSNTGENSGDSEDIGIESSGDVVTAEKVQVKRPSLYKVILINDDFTPMDFVVTILEKFFHRSHEESTEIMLNVHTKGFGVAGVYPLEIAETKVAQVSEYAREHEHPLQCKVERA